LGVPPAPEPRSLASGLRFPHSFDGNSPREQSCEPTSNDPFGESPAAVGLIRAFGAALAALVVAGGTHAQPQPSPAPAADTPAVSGAQPAEATLVKSPWDAPEPWRTDRFYLETSLYTVHFNGDSDHDNSQQLILFEWNITEQWLVGAAVFDNSYGQSSQYVYGGYRFRPFEKAQELYFKISAGIVHGYKGEYQNKIPFNGSGFAPVIVPSVGYCINRFCSELVIFGTAGALLTFGVTLP
jgi:hypothetical protein